MQIIKRNGTQVEYRGDKIIQAMKKAFVGISEPPAETELATLLAMVEAKLPKEQLATVEGVQDLVEQALMERGHYQVAKAYILYREERTRLRTACIALADSVRIEGLDACLDVIQQDFAGEEYSLNRLRDKFLSFEKPDLEDDKRLAALTKAAVELTTQEAPRWELIAARLVYFRFERNLKVEMEKRAIDTFWDKLNYLTREGLYGSYILKHYSRAEVDQAAELLDNSRNHLFTYSGLDLLLSRYVIHTHSHVALETPQEMYLGIALHLAMEEKQNRLVWIKKFYDMLSLMQVTMATPTLSNARKPYHQLSSCFIDTVPDSLDGIYRSVDNFSKVSKFGGGMGLYFGKVRATGGSIRGFQGAAGGVIRWIKLVNDTAVAVDQLGMRQGAVAVYLDAWHKDLPEFLQLRTNNGDDRMKAHDVFPAVSYPDLFWKMVREDMEQNWYLICPHEVSTVKGYHLEDYWGEEWEKRYLECVADGRISKRAIPLKDLVRLILKSAVETGTPFTFNRDTVNRYNPNKHSGIIYCSNLCTEIAQNMSEIELLERKVETREGDTVVVTVTKPGDFVVCNLASLSLGNIPVEETEVLRDIVNSAVRALDNVIDLNFYPVEYAQITNHKYRSIGLGVSGYHHMLAKRKIAWESEEHFRFVDEVFENINFAAVAASNGLAKEKGSYSQFEGSDWQTGAYFDLRSYTSPRWQQLRESVHDHGMRNAYLMAIAPTSSTSILSGTTAGLDPVMNRYFLEEKKGVILPRVAPELSMETYWYYKAAHVIDQSYSVRAGGIRQRHIDQAQSMNLYITTDYSMRKVLDLYLQAWEEGVKTLYYVRSKSLEVEECDSCTA